MPVRNADIAAIFSEIADLLEIEEANPFRIRAYRTAARVIAELGPEAHALVERGDDLTKLRGIGKDLAAKIAEIVATGRCSALDKLRTELPPAVDELLHVPGLGPKRVRLLWLELDVHTADDLVKAAQAGRIRDIPGFGAKTEANILAAVTAHLSKKRRYPRGEAAPYAEALVDWLRTAQGVARVEVAGSYRRGSDSVGDLDILIVAAPDSDVIRHFVDFREVAEVLSQGQTRASAVLRNGLQVDLRVVAAESYGSALCYFTGSKAHNIALRKIAQARGLKLNEYGVFDGTRRIAGDSEEAVYRALGLKWIPPERREDEGEIEAARLPAEDAR
jgi:DNA polymerase (family 10)